MYLIRNNENHLEAYDCLYDRQCNLDDKPKPIEPEEKKDNDEDEEEVDKIGLDEVVKALYDINRIQDERIIRLNKRVDDLILKLKKVVIF